MSTQVLLLRDPSDASPDPYVAEFAAKGVTATNVPVLETALTNLEELHWVIETGPTFHGYTGVIVTSGRSVEAWAKAAQDAIKVSTSDHTKADWSQTPFFVVGEATATKLKNLQSTLPAHLSPKQILGGEETGTSERLAHFIVSHDSQKTEKKKKPKLLYLTGDKNRDTLPKIVEDAGMELDAVQVYETRGSSNFAVSLKAAVDTKGKVKHWWIVFFAPSSAEFAAPILREHFKLTKKDVVPKKKKLQQAKIAAIGPTTATHLRDKLSIEEMVVAEKPNPESLARVILA